MKCLIKDWLCTRSKGKAVIKQNTPIVHYSDLWYINIGTAAIVTPIDHPSSLVSNNTIVRTSPVLKINRDNKKKIVSFVTMNTLYVKAHFGDQDVDEKISSIKEIVQT